LQRLQLRWRHMQWRHLSSRPHHPSSPRFQRLLSPTRRDSKRRSVGKLFNPPAATFRTDGNMAYSSNAFNGFIHVHHHRHPDDRKAGTVQDESFGCLTHIVYIHPYESIYVMSVSVTSSSDRLKNLEIGQHFGACTTGPSVKPALQNSRYSPHNFPSFNAEPCRSNSVNLLLLRRPKIFTRTHIHTHCVT